MAFSKREGEILIDHRASPGLPEDIARWAGYDPQLTREGKLYEAGTLTCAHCKAAVVKNPNRARPRENCPKCGYRYLCDFCYAETQTPDYIHAPFEKKADEYISLNLRKGILYG
jgi:hypothetical protein